jgi:hypothetical protein
MQKIFAIVSLLILTSSVLSAQQSNKNDTINERIKELEDKLALRELVDSFSILADKKDVSTQVLLFTEYATVETFSGGARVANLKGRKEMANAFAPFLATFEKVYHFNGQHVVRVEGDRATGTLYCMVTLIGLENSKRMKTTMGVFYNDEYVRKDNKWFIAKRVSTFDWTDKTEMK